MAEETDGRVSPSDWDFNTVELPPSIEIKESSIHKGEGGAFAKSLIRKATRFGPYKGEIVFPGERAFIDYRFAWEVFEKDSNDFKYTICAMDPQTSNWMRHVNCARFYEEQNIISIQEGYSIFYIAMKDIKAGEELLTWFDPKLLKRSQRQLSKIVRKPVGYTIELVPWSEEKKFVPQIIETKRARKKKVLSDMICLDEDPLAITRTLQRLPKIPTSRKQLAQSSSKELSPSPPPKPIVLSPPPKPSAPTMQAQVKQKGKRGRKPKNRNIGNLNAEDNHVNGYFNSTDTGMAGSNSSSQQNIRTNDTGKSDMTRSEGGAVKVKKKRGRKPGSGLLGKTPLKVGRPRLRRTSDGQIAHEDLATVKPIIVKLNEDGSSIIEDHDETYTLRNVELRPECDNLCPCLDKQQAMKTQRSLSPHKQKEKIFVIHFTLLPEHKSFSPDNKIIYKCDVCDSAYNHAFSLKRHYLSVHINHRYLSRNDILACQIETFHTGVQLENSESSLNESQPSAMTENIETSALKGEAMPVMGMNLSALNIKLLSAPQNSLVDQGKANVKNADIEKHLLCEESLNDEDGGKREIKLECISGQVPSLKHLAQKSIDCVRTSSCCATVTLFQRDEEITVPLKKEICDTELRLECDESLSSDLLCPVQSDTSSSTSISSVPGGKANRGEQTHESAHETVNVPNHLHDSSDPHVIRVDEHSMKSKTMNGTVPTNTSFTSVSVEAVKDSDKVWTSPHDFKEDNEISRLACCDIPDSTTGPRHMNTDTERCPEGQVESTDLPPKCPSKDQEFLPEIAKGIRDKSTNDEIMESESQNQSDTIVHSHSQFVQDTSMSTTLELAAKTESCEAGAVSTHKLDSSIQSAEALIAGENRHLSDTKCDSNENVLKKTRSSSALPESLSLSDSEIWNKTAKDVIDLKSQTLLSEDGETNTGSSEETQTPCSNSERDRVVEIPGTTSSSHATENEDNHFTKETSPANCCKKYESSSAEDNGMEVDKITSNEAAASNMTNAGSDLGADDIIRKTNVSSTESQGTPKISEVSTGPHKDKNKSERSSAGKDKDTADESKIDPTLVSSKTDATPESSTVSGTVAGTPASSAQNVTQNPVPQQVIFVTNIVFPIVSPTQKPSPTPVSSVPSSTAPSSSTPVAVTGTPLTSQAPGVPLVLISQLPHGLNVQNAANAFLQSSTALKTLQTIQSSLNVANLGNTATRLSASNLSTGNIPIPTVLPGSGNGNLQLGILPAPPAHGSPTKCQPVSATAAVTTGIAESKSTKICTLNTSFENSALNPLAKTTANQHQFASKGSTAVPSPTKSWSPVKTLSAVVNQPDDLYRCHMCVLVFKTMSELKQHIKNDPHRFKGGIKQYACLQCSMRFSNKNNLMRHNLMNHPENENYPYRCFTCGKGFSSETYLKMHARFHSGKNFPCKYGCVDVCFPNAASLVKHLRAQHAGLNLKEYLRNAKAEKARRKKLNRIFGVSDEQIAQLGIDGKAEEKSKPPVVPYSMNQPGVGFQAKRGRPKGSKNIKRIKDVFLEKRSQEPDVELGKDVIESSTESQKISARKLTLRFTCKLCPKRFPTHLKLLQHRTRKHGASQSVQEYLFQMSKDVQQDISDIEVPFDISPPPSPKTFFSNVNRRGFENVKNFIDGKSERLKLWRNFVKVEDYISISEPQLPAEKQEKPLQWTTYNFPPCFEYKEDCTTFYNGTTSMPDKSAYQIKCEVLDDVDSSTENLDGPEIQSNIASDCIPDNLGKNKIVTEPNTKGCCREDTGVTVKAEETALQNGNNVKEECLKDLCDLTVSDVNCDNGMQTPGKNELDVAFSAENLIEYSQDENVSKTVIKQEVDNTLESENVTVSEMNQTKCSPASSETIGHKESNLKEEKHNLELCSSKLVSEDGEMQGLGTVTEEPAATVSCYQSVDDHRFHDNPEIENVTAVLKTPESLKSQNVAEKSQHIQRLSEKFQINHISELNNSEKLKMLQSCHIQGINLEQGQKKTFTSAVLHGQSPTFQLLNALDLHISRGRLSSKQLQEMLEATNFSASMGYGRIRTLSLPSLGIMSPTKRSNRYFEHSADTTHNTSDTSRSDHRRYSIWARQFHKKSNQRDKEETFCCPVVEAVRKQDTMEQKKMYIYEKAARDKEVDKRRYKLIEKMAFAESMGLMSRREFELSHHAKKQNQFIIKPPEVWDNYENIWFGKKGTITVVCSICHRHFSCWDLCLRHQLKKHPHIEPSSLEMERDNYVEDLYYYYPMQYGILAQTSLIPENLPPPEVYVCTRCGFPFKNLNRLHAHIIACDPIQEDTATLESSSHSKPSFMKQKLLPMMDRRLNQNSDPRPQKAKVGRPFKNPANALRADAEHDRNRDSHSTLRPKGPYTAPLGTTQTVQQFPIISTMAPSSEHKSFHSRPTFSSSFSFLTGRRRKNYELLYNPQNHTRRREMYKVLDQHQCHGCNLKFKSLSLLERHVKKCSGKDKLRSQKPLLSGIMPDDAALRKQHTCRYCNKRFTYIKGVDLHYKRICTVRKVKEEENKLTKEDLEHEAELRRIIEHLKWSKSLNKDSSDIIQGHVRVEEDGSLTRVVKKRGWPRGLKKKVKKKGFKWTTLKRHRTDDDIQAVKPASQGGDSSPDIAAKSDTFPPITVAEKGKDNLEPHGGRRLTRSASLEAVQQNTESTRKRKTAVPMNDEEPPKKRGRTPSQSSSSSSLSKNDSQSSLSTPETRTGRRTGRRGRPQKFSPDDYDKPSNRKQTLKQKKEIENAQECPVTVASSSQSNNGTVSDVTEAVIKPPARKRGRPKKYDPSDMESTYKKKKKAETLLQTLSGEVKEEDKDIVSSGMLCQEKGKSPTARDGLEFESSSVKVKSSEDTVEMLSSPTTSEKKNCLSKPVPSLVKKDSSEVESAKLLEKMKQLKDAAKLETTRAAQARKTSPQLKAKKSHSGTEVKKFNEMGEKLTVFQKSDQKPTKLTSSSLELLKHLTKEEEEHSDTKKPSLQTSNSGKEKDTPISNGVASYQASRKVLPTVSSSTILKRKVSTGNDNPISLKKSKVVHQTGGNDSNNATASATSKTIVHIRSVAPVTSEMNVTKSTPLVAKIAKKSSTQKSVDGVPATKSEYPLVSSAVNSTKGNSQNHSVRGSVSTALAPTPKPPAVSVRVVTLSPNKMNFLTRDTPYGASPLTTTDPLQPVTSLTSTTPVPTSQTDPTHNILGSLPSSSIQLLAKTPIQVIANVTQGQSKGFISKPSIASSQKPGMVISSTAVTTGPCVQSDQQIISSSQEKASKHQESDVHAGDCSVKDSQGQYKQGDDIMDQSSDGLVCQTPSDQEPKTSSDIHVQDAVSDGDMVKGLGKGAQPTKLLYTPENACVTEELIQEVKTDKLTAPQAGQVISKDKKGPALHTTNQTSTKSAAVLDQSSLRSGEITLLCTAGQASHKQSAAKTSQKLSAGKVTLSAQVKRKQNIISSLPQTQLAAGEHTHLQMKGGSVRGATQQVAPGMEQVHFISPSKLSSNVALAHASGLPTIRLANPASLAESPASVPTIIVPSSTVRLPGVASSSSTTTRLTSPLAKFVSPTKMVTLAGTILPGLISGNSISAGAKLLKLGNIPVTCTLQTSTGPPVTVSSQGAKASASSRVIPAIVTQRPLMLNTAQMPRAVPTGTQLQRPQVQQTVVQRPVARSQVLNTAGSQGGISNRPPLLVRPVPPAAQQIYIQHPSGNKNIVTVAQPFHVPNLETQDSGANRKSASAVNKPGIVNLPSASLPANQIMFSLDDGTTAMLDPDTLAQFLSISPSLNKTEPSPTGAKLMTDSENSHVTAADNQSHQQATSDDGSWSANGSVDLSELPDSTCDL